MAASKLFNGGDVGIQEQIDVPGLVERLSARARDDTAIVTIVPRVLVPDICRIMALKS